MGITEKLAALGADIRRIEPEAALARAAEDRLFRLEEAEGEVPAEAVFAREERARIQVRPSWA